MKVFKAIFNNGVDTGNFLVFAEDCNSAKTVAEKFLNRLSEKEMSYVAGSDWILMSMQEVYSTQFFDGLVVVT